jgi:trehalose/maltose transport system permease protein
VAGYPLGKTLLLSFTDAQLLDIGVTPQWVGLDNFSALWEDSDWWRAVRNTVVFTVISVAFEALLGLGIALMLHAEFRGRAILRTSMLVPWAIPTVVAAQLWAWMLNDVYGVVNDLAARTGLDRLLVAMGVIEKPPVAWLADPALMLASVIAVDVWKTTPFMALLLLAGLQGIPRDLYEAAAVDGAGAWARFRHVVMPLLMPAMGVALIFRTLDALRVFDVIYVMTGTTPSTWSMAIYTRQQLVDFADLGYGSAASTGIFFVIALFTAAYLTMLRAETE